MLQLPVEEPLTVEESAAAPWLAVDETTIISLALDDPEHFKTIAHRLSPELFERRECQYLCAMLLDQLKTHGQIPSREVFHSIVAKTFKVDDPWESTIAIVDAPTNPRNAPRVKELLTGWVKQRAFAMIYDTPCIEAFKRGDYSTFRKIIDEAEAIGADTAAEKFLSGQELWDRPEEITTWLIQDVLAADQPCIIGGPSKTLKTKLALDAALSIQSGSKFLGRYQASKKNVAFVSGESGPDEVVRHLKLMAMQRGLNGASLPWLFFRALKLADPATQAWLRGELTKNHIEVLFIDPLYLCLTNGTDVEAANIFSMGPLFASINQLCREVGCTLVLLHHYSRKGGVNYRPPKLGDLTYAGATEFMRQWILLNRTEEYQMDGQHGLWVVSGGSGRADLLRLAVDEGEKGRPDWQVGFLETDVAKICGTVADKGKRHAKDRADKEKIITMTGPITARSVRKALHGGPVRADRLLEELTDAGKLELAAEMETTDGRRFPTYTVRLAECGPQTVSGRTV